MRFATLTALVVTFVPNAAWAFECTLSAPFCVVSARFEDPTVRYVVRRPPPESNISETQLVEAARAAFDTWAEPRCTSIRFELAGVLDEGVPSEVKNEIRVVADKWPGNPRARATTRVAFDPTRGHIKSSTIALNAVHSRFGDVEQTPSCVDVTDLRATLVHEVGHFIGIAHPCEPDDAEAACDGEVKCPRATCSEMGMAPALEDRPAMWPNLDPCQTHLRDLTKDDLEAVCSIYPNTGPALACASIPVAEDGELVANAAFGCTHTESRGTDGSWVWLLIAAPIALRRR